VGGDAGLQPKFILLNLWYNSSNISVKIRYFEKTSAMRWILLVILFSSSTLFGQDKFPDNGRLELGLRSTLSLFGTNNTTGLGVGGQFRLRLLKQVNTEWFADYITNNLEGLGKRTDGHIGWSVLFYPFNAGKKIEPYLIAGHCFDYTKVSIYSDGYAAPEEKERWSSAVQMGLGTSFHVSERVNFSLSAQYMLHLGKDIHTHIHEENGQRKLHFEDEAHTGFEGHVFLTLSMNIKLADLW
jgi:opacity protein-like surface antigen